jgi:predicted amidohydrolase
VLKIALANLAFPTSPDAAVEACLQAIGAACEAGADLICFPECFVPGYRALGAPIPPADPVWLASAHQAVAAAARQHRITVVLGTERFVEARLRITALVVGPDGAILGWQDKVQLDPSEDHLYQAGAGREVFAVAGVDFAVVICHEGFRYPETVRTAVRKGAQLVLHPHYSQAEPGGWRPAGYAEAGNSFHEAAARCRAAENTCWFATVNCAGPDSPTTSAVIEPDGTVLAWQRHGESGLLIADLDPTVATRALALRLRTSSAG